MISSSQPTTAQSNGGCYANGCSAVLCFVGGLLLIVGSCIPQRRYADNSGFFNRNVDLYFYQQESSQFGGTTYTADIPDCIKPAYSAGMAMGIIGGAAALLGGVPLTYCATKLMTSPLRFVRPLVIVGGGSLGLIAAIISAATTKCDGSDFASNYKLFAGFGLLIAGAVILLLSALIGFMQASKCPDASAPVQVAVASQEGGAHPQGAFASNNQSNNQANTTGTYNFAAAQHQQQQHQGVHQQQQGTPVMGFAMNEQPSNNNQGPPYGGGGLYGGGGGGPVYGNNNGGGGIY